MHAARRRCFSIPAMASCFVVRWGRGACAPKAREFHLDTENAENLVREVVNAYTRDHGGPPDELFIHARQRFEDKEWKGFEAAVPKSTRLVGVRIRPTQVVRLFRPEADTPVLRGTAVTMSRREGYLWTTGYISLAFAHIPQVSKRPSLFWWKSIAARPIYQW